MPVTDTSWLYALFDEADPHHQEAVAQARGAGPYQAPNEVLAELLHLRHTRAKAQGLDGGREARRMLQDLLGAGVRILGDCPVEAALSTYRRHRGLSYTDAVAVAFAKKEGRLLTFDKRQARAAAAK